MTTRRAKPHRAPDAIGLVEESGPATTHPVVGRAQGARRRRVDPRPLRCSTAGHGTGQGFAGGQEHLAQLVARSHTVLVVT